MINNYCSKREKIEINCFFVFQKITFDIIYWFVIKNTYVDIPLLMRGYARNAFSFNFNPIKYIIAWMITIMLSNIFTSYVLKEDKPHEILLTALFCISFFPNMTIFGMSDYEWSFLAGNAVFWLILIFATHFFTKKRTINSSLINNKEPVKIQKKNSKIVFWTIILIYVVGSVLLSIVYFGGFHIDLSFSTKEVYTSRLAARGAFGTLTNYFRHNAMYIVLPLLLIICLVKKRYLLCGISCICLLLVYSIDSQKAVLMLLLVSIVMAMLVKKKISKLIIKGIPIINIILVIFQIFTGNLTIVDSLFKRIYFLPAILGHCHLEYVNGNQSVVFLSSLLSKFGIITNYAYTQLALPFQIGQKYFGSSAISANTGAFAGAYDYGFLGLFIVPIIYAFLFKLLDKACVNVLSNYYIAILVPIAFSIVGATLPSVLTVYGFLTALLLLYLMGCSKDFNIIKKGRIRLKLKLKRTNNNTIT